MKDFERPEVLHGRTYKVRTGCGSLYVTINDDVPEGGKPIEMFLRLGKAGGCASATAETTGRLVSEGISCHSSSEEKPSCVHAASVALAHLEEA
jgi:ribonucleoside-diphosphate reductase alpha chain